MKRFVLTVCATIIFGVVNSASIKPSEQIKEAFTRHQLVPEVTQALPTNVIKVEYKKSNKLVNLGNELKPKDVAEAPFVSYEADPKAFYTLAMVDPDAPSRQTPTSREWQHWLVVNVPGGDLAKGQTLAPYQGPAPPKNTGLHRYVFLLYKQTGKVEFQEPVKTVNGKDRAKFSVQKFADKYKLGSPVAGNVFQAKFEEPGAAPAPPK